MTDFSKALSQGETVRKSAGVSNVSLVVTAGWLALVVIATWLGLGYLFNLSGGSPSGAAMAPFMNLLLNLMVGILAVVAFWGMLMIVLRSIFTRYALTDSRVLRRSLLRIRGAELMHVQDVEVSQSILGKLLGYGDVVVRTASTDGTLVLHRVNNPHDWFREISALRG